MNIKEIRIKNNSLVKEAEIKKLLKPVYNKSLLFLKNKEIEKAVMQNSFIDSFNVKKSIQTL